jgi:hypothetical protein
MSMKVHQRIKIIIILLLNKSLVFEVSTLGSKSSRPPPEQIRTCKTLFVPNSSVVMFHLMGNPSVQPSSCGKGEKTKSQQTQVLSLNEALPSKLTGLERIAAGLLKSIHIWLTPELSKSGQSDNSELASFLKDLGTHQGHGYNSDRIPSD